MKVTDIARRAGRNLRQAKGRTILTSLAIAVGAFTMTLSLAAGEGARQYADNLLKNNIDPQSIFIVKDKQITEGSRGSGVREYSDDLSSASNGMGSGVSVKMLTDSDIDELKKRDDLEQVLPMYTISAKYVQFEGNDKKYVIPVNYYDASVLAPVAAGSLPSLGQQIREDEILMPEDALGTLGLTAENAVGKRVVLTVSQTAGSVDEAAMREAFLSGGEAAVQNLLQPRTREFSYKVRAVLKKSAMAIASNPQLHVSAGQAKVISDYINEGTTNAGKYMAATAIAKGDPMDVKRALLDKYDGWSVQTAEDAQGVLFTFVNVLQGIVSGFAVLALIASVFGIVNTQYISVLERTSQIGLMKALGMSGKGIAKLFRYEAAWIGFIGGVLGAILAIVLGTLLNPWITETLSLGEGNSLLVFVWWQVAILIVSLVVIAIAAGWFPARKAAKLDPIEALRTE